MTLSDIATPILALSVVLVELFIEDENKNKKNLKKAMLLIFGVGTFGFSLDSSYESSKSADKLKERSDSLITSQGRVEKGQKDLQIAQLKNSLAEQVMSDTQKALLDRVYNYDSITYRDFGVKLDKLKKDNDSLLSAGLKDADIELLPEPHSVFSYTCSDTKISFNLKFVNLGDKLAYNTTSNFNIIAKSHGKFYRFSSDNKLVMPTMPPTVSREISYYYLSDNVLPMCNMIDTLYYFVEGYYFLDEKHKIKRTYSFGLIKSKSDATPYKWNYNESVSDFIKKAELIPSKEGKQY